VEIGMADAPGFRGKRETAGDELASEKSYPVFDECIPEPLTRTGKYEVHYAHSSEELEAIQKLRFSVFNLELGEGLEESFKTGRDRDRFDPVCHHLMVNRGDTGDVVGTYRIQTNVMADTFDGYYSVDEFDLSRLPADVITNAVEVGRACVARDFRNRHVLFLLWRGLAAYMEKNEKRYLFGCCSLTSQDPVEGKRVMDYLRQEGHVHTGFEIRPQPGWECYDEANPPELPDTDDKVDLPQLFRIYLRYGAKVCGPPALDRFFKTIDYLVVLDIEDLDDDARATFFRKYRVAVRLLRVTLRLLALFLVLPVYYVWIVVSDAALRAARRLRGSRESTGLRRTRFIQHWARVVAKLLGMRRESRRAPPASPFFLVSNHVSYTDIIAIAAQVPCVFVAKAEVADWPVMGSICRAVDTLFIDRRSKRDIPRVMKEIETILQEGRGVVIFPEGTSTSGASMIRFKPSLLEIAARAGIPVSHVCVYYETPPGSPPASSAVCWWGGAGFMGHILKLLQLPWFRARLTFGEEPVRATDRKELATRLQESVERDFEPMA